MNHRVRCRKSVFGAWRAGVVLAALCGCLAAPAAGAAGVAGRDSSPTPQGRQQQALDAWLKDTHILRWLLKQHGLEPITGFEGLAEDPQHTLLLVLGDAGSLRDVPGGLREFLTQGGTALVATDQRVDAPDIAGQLREVAGVRMPGRRVIGLPPSERAPVWVDGPNVFRLRRWGANQLRAELLHQGAIPPQFGHRGQFDRPFVTAAGRRLPGGPPNPFENLKVATNIPAFLELENDRPAGVQDLAEFIDGCFTESVNGRLPQNCYERARTPPLFAVGGEVGKGRVLVLADHSVFINEMMRPRNDDDKQNLEFAHAALDWLGAKSVGERSRALLVVDGRIERSFDVKFPLKSTPTPLPPLDELAGFVDRRAAALERRVAEAEGQGGFDARLVDRLTDHGLLDWSRVGRSAAVLVTLALGVYAVSRLGGAGRYRSEPDLADVGDLVAVQGTAAPPVEERRRELVEAGNLWEAARGLARRRLAAHAAAPQFAAHGPWRVRRAAARRADRLWHLAYSPAPVRVPPSAWRGLLDDLDRLDADLAAGTLRPRAPRS